MDKIIRVLNRRNCKRKADCYERPNRRRLNDEYFVQWKKHPPSWVKFEKLITLPGGKQEVKKFEKSLRTYHRCLALKNGLKPILITAMGNHCGHDIFVCLFLGYEELAPVMAATIYEYCPELAIRFFENNLKFQNYKAVIEIPLRMQKRTALVYNKFILQLNPNSFQDSNFEKKCNNIEDDDNDVDTQHISSDGNYNMIEKLDLKKANKDKSKLWEQPIFDNMYNVETNTREVRQNWKTINTFFKDFMFRQKILANHLFAIDEVD